MTQLAAIVLAAGQGSRMKSKYPKVLHPLLGKPMVQYVIDAARGVGAEPIIVVIGFGGEQVRERIGERVAYVWQREQLGTAHAVKMAREELSRVSGDVLVLYGDTPLISEETLTALVETKRREAAAAVVLTVEMANPGSYGRIIRDTSGRVTAIVEAKDASPDQKQITEVNTGIYCFTVAPLLEALEELRPINAQGEYYLTDVIKIFAAKGQRVIGKKLDEADEVMGPNDRVQLAQTEAYLKQKINHHWMRAGVTIVDPLFTYIGPEVAIGQDTVILPGSFIDGQTVIGEDCVIGPHTRIQDTIVGPGTVIQFSEVIGSDIGPENQVGPYAYIRPGTKSAARVKFGDFVEVKNCRIGPGSKIPHLSYLGDSELGKDVNIGAGTITCNYDGVHKHPTVIGDNAFIGSNSNLVAPVTIGRGATIAAGSTITKDVPEQALGVARNRQTIKENWKSAKERAGK